MSCIVVRRDPVIESHWRLGRRHERLCRHDGFPSTSELFKKKIQFNMGVSTRSRASPSEPSLSRGRTRSRGRSRTPNTPKPSSRSRTPITKTKNSSKRQGRTYVPTNLEKQKKVQRTHNFFKRKAVQFSLILALYLLYNSFVSPSFDYDLHNLKPSNITLHNFFFLATHNNKGYNLALGPVFFGFYSYFGILSGLNIHNFLKVTGATGSSAGAIAAAMFCSPPPLDFDRIKSSVGKIQFSEINDFPGYLALFHGSKAAVVLEDLNGGSMDLEDCHVPYLPTAFDLVRMRGVVLTSGDAALATLASATFPFLFSPQLWVTNKSPPPSVLVATARKAGLGNTLHQLKRILQGASPEQQYEKQIPSEPPLHQTNNNNNNNEQMNLLIDGGVSDHMGLAGVPLLPPSDFLVSIVGSTFLRDTTLKHTTNTHQLTIFLSNLPNIGPFTMHRGATAVEVAEQKIIEALGSPNKLLQGPEENHFVLHLDLSAPSP